MWSWPAIDVWPAPGIPPDWEDYFNSNLGLYETPTDVLLSKGGDMDGDGREELNLVVKHDLGYFPISEHRAAPAAVSWPPT